MPSGLSALGLEPLEETVYRWLLTAGLSSVSEIARGARVPLAQARTAVAALEHRGAVTRAPGRPARFSPSPPELALEALIWERDQALGAARLEVKRLQEEYWHGASRRNPVELAEIVQGGDAVRRRVEQLWRSPREEILAFDKPPYSVPPEEVIDSDLWPAQGSGVRCKTLYSKESLEIPGALDLIEQFVRRGEEVRFFPDIPMKLNIFDRRVALIPLAEERGLVEGAIVVHSSHLLDALLALWETFWERGFPIPIGKHGPQPAVDDLSLSEAQARLVAMLLGGMTSESISHQMNLGLSTVERRISSLMTSLGVRTRFQAGFELGRRGYLPPSGASPEALTR